MSALGVSQLASVGSHQRMAKEYRQANPIELSEIGHADVKASALVIICFLLALRCKRRASGTRVRMNHCDIMQTNVRQQA
jgi:hypothetical protein